MAANTSTPMYLNDAAHAPKAIGPYSQAVAAGNLVFLSGQIGISPESGEIVQGGIEKQAEQVLQNLKAVLAHAGVSFSNVVKSTIFLTNLAHFQAVNAIYEKALAGVRPARSTVQVAALPRGAEIEIEMVALR